MALLLIWFLLTLLSPALHFASSTQCATTPPSTRPSRVLGRRRRLLHVGHSLVTSLRGGSTVAARLNTDVNTTVHNSSPCNVLVSTLVGSSFLDKKKRLTLPSNATVADLKEQIRLKFPGSPPKELQRLFFGMRPLADEQQPVGNLSALNPVPILLDMITGTSAYNKTLSISQALEAYASIAVQQSFVGDRLKGLFASAALDGSGGSEANASIIIDTTIYREMFIAVNRSLHDTYLQDIDEALVEEQEPETLSADTAAWRQNKKDKSPITVALAKEFDLNLRGIRNFAYYSVLLGVFALFGTTTQLSTKLLLLMVPLLWVSKLRQLRLVAKLAVNFIVSLVPKVEFLMPLLPAPYQVIAVEVNQLNDDSLAEGRKEARRPIIPRLRRGPSRLP